ncbi:MAG: GGDEF domain-containing response regulator [Fimbriiglobus sp.]
MRSLVHTVAPEPKPTLSPATITLEGDTLSTQERYSILIVDDEPAILALLSNQLARDFRVITACSTEQAKRAIMVHSPDIVLSDLQLPDGSGLEFLTWVQSTIPSSRRVLLTGTASIEDAADAINCSRVHRLLLKPWRGEHLLETINSVAHSLMIERSHSHLVSQLRHSHLELEQRVADRTRELEVANQQLQLKNLILEKMALTDPLTGLPNRRSIELVARKELIRRTRLKRPTAIGIIDADRFKSINSKYLLCGGDHVLNWLAQILQNSTRSSDSIGRVGGEEFMVVAPDTDVAGANVLAERLRSTVAAQPTIYQGESIPITVSIGMAVLDSDAIITYEQLRSVATAALDEAKSQGRNCCVTKIYQA